MQVYGFHSEQLYNEKQFQVLNILDTFSKECVRIYETRHIKQRIAEVIFSSGTAKVLLME